MHIFSGQVASEGIVIGCSLNISSDHDHSISEDDDSAETLSQL